MRKSFVMIGLLAAWVLWAGEPKNGQWTWTPVARFEPVALEQESSPSIGTPMFLCALLQYQLRSEVSSFKQTTFRCLAEGESPPVLGQ